MEGFEGIKFTLSHEYLGEEKILSFTRNVEAARKASEAFQKASNKVRDAGRTRAGTKDQKEAADATKEEVRAAKALSKEVKALLRQYRERAKAASRGERSYRNELDTAKKLLAIRTDELAKERQAGIYASEKDKESLRARTALAAIETKRNKQERASADLVKQRATFEAKNLIPQTEKQLSQLLRKNKLLGDEQRVSKDVMAIRRELLKIDQARSNLKLPERTPLQNTRDNAAAGASKETIQNILAKNQLDEEIRLAKVQATAARQRAKDLKESVRLQQRALDLSQRLEAVERASKRITRLRAENAALEQGVRGRAILAAVERDILKIEQLRGQAQTTADPARRAELLADVAARRANNTKRLADENKRLFDEQQKVNNQADKGATAFSKLAGTIRGVVVGLLVYRGITRGSQLFGQLIRDSVTFGAELENSRAAIAGLVVGAGELVTSEGRVLEGAEKFTAALGIAQQQLAAIQQEAIGTSSTFQDLQRNFQLNVSQGLLSGLNIDEFREVTKLFSQGATLFGVPQNQLAEEIRSVLQGTIRARDTRIAVALGITNQDIERAREAGTLFEFLEERFDGVSQASEAIRNTLPVILSDIEDAFQISSSSGATGLRRELTELASQVRDALVLDDASGVDPRIAERFAKVFEPLRRVVAQLKQDTGPLTEIFFSTTEALTRLIEVGAGVGQVLAPAFLATINVFSGFVAGLNQIILAGARVIEFLAGIGANLNGFGDGAKSTTAALESLGKAIAFLVGAALLGKMVALVGGAVVGLYDMAKAAKAALLGVKVLDTGIKLLSIKLLTGIVAIALTATAIGGLASVIDDDLGKALDSAVDKATSVEFLGQALDPLVKTLSSASQVLGDAFDGVSLDVGFGNSERVAEFTESLFKLQEAAKGFSNLALGAGIGNSLAGALDQNLEAAKGLTNELDLQEAAIRNNIKEAKEEYNTRLQTTEELRRQLKIAERQQELALTEKNAAFRGVTQTPREETEALRRTLDREGGIEFDAFEVATRQEEAQRAYNKALITSSGIKEKLKEAERESLENLTAQQKGERDLRRLAELRTKVLQDQANAWAAQLKAVADANRLEVQSEAQRLSFDRNTVRQETSLGGSTTLQAQRIREENDLRREALEITIRQQELQRELAATQTLLQGQSDIFARAGTTDAGEIARDLDVLRQKEQNIRDAIAGTNEELELNNKLRERQAKLDSFGFGIQGALQDRQRGVTNAQIGSNATNAALDFAQQTPTALFTEALRSAAYATEPEFNRIFADAGIQLAGNLFQGLVDKAIIQPLLGSLVDDVDPLQVANNVALGSNTAAVLANTTALLTGTTIGAITSATRSATSTGLFNIFAKGGPVRGFDSGGPSERRGTTLPSSVPGYDPRDRILGLMRPGEFVVTPEMMFKDPGLLAHLEMLRRAAHFGAGLPDFSRLRKPVGFAAGGPTPSASSASKGGSSMGRVTRAQYQPVLVLDSKFARRVHNDPSFSVGLAKASTRRASRFLK